MLKYRTIFGFFAVFLSLGFYADAYARTGASLFGAGASLVTAATLTDAEVQELGKATANAMDAKNKVAPANNPYTQRLNKLVANLKNEAGLNLNYKVYLTNTVNAFACPDGSIRIFSGLMDMMDDDELYFVIGHEIGHVANGDSANRLRVAYTTAGVRQAVGAVGGTIGALSSTQLANIGEALINAQFSQSQEYQADAYGLKLLQRDGKNSQAAVTALRKLATPGRAPSMFSTHPEPGKRADAIAAQIAK